MLSGFLYTVLAIYVLWMYYLAVMSLYRAKKAGTLTKVGYVLGLPILVSGVLLNVVINVTFCSALFMELPKEFLVSQRLQRLSKKDNWRKKIVEFVAKHFLDTFDPSGRHI